jgi:hypothetical protein
MGENEEKGRMKEINRILLEIRYLCFKPVPRVIERMNLIDPQGFAVKGVEPQAEAYEEASNKDQYLLPS